jgi:hypothetical protein
MRKLHVRGVLSPAFLALGIAAGLLGLSHLSPVFIWLTLIFLALGLALAHETNRLLSGTDKDHDA